MASILENEGRGYVLRRMMRRTIRNMRLLGSEDLVISELIKSSIQAMGPQYPELVANQDRILAVANAEEDSFLQTLKSGTSIFDVAASDLKRASKHRCRQILHLNYMTLMDSHLI